MSDKIEQLKQWYEQEQIRIKQEFDSKLKELEKKELEPLVIPVDSEMNYHLICNNIVYERVNLSNNIDVYNYNTFNYYHTKEEAQKVQARELLARKVFLARSLARKDGKHDNDEWLPDWNNKSEWKYELFCNEGRVHAEVYYTSINSLSFRDKNQVSIFRKYISDEEIRKFLEG